MNKDLDTLLELGYSVHIQPTKSKKEKIFGSVVGPKGIFTSKKKDCLKELLEKVRKANES